MPNEESIATKTAQKLMGAVIFCYSKIFTQLIKLSSQNSML
jgi:hypothetical protein